MYTRVYLNEGTQLDIKWSKKDLRKLIKEKAKLEEKDGIKDNFVEVHCDRMIDQKGTITPINTQVDLYTKRILFYYEIQNHA